MASYEGHYNKRQKTEEGSRGHYDDSYDRNSRNENRNQDRHCPDVSPVVHVRGLPERLIEDDIVAAVQHFGSVAYVMLLPRRNQALVEFTDEKGASACVNFSNSNQLLIRGQPAFFNYSTSRRIQRPHGVGGDGDMGNQQFVAPNKILLFTVINAKYPITVDVMHTITSAHGRVEKIVIFKKQHVQAMVQFENVESAKAAREQLNDCDIYSGCCTLRIEYAKTDELRVRYNNNESWDYTVSANQPPPGRKNPPLLADPRYTAAPTPYDVEYDEYQPEGGQSRPAYGGQYEEPGYEYSPGRGRAPPRRSFEQQGGGGGGYGRGRGGGGLRPEPMSYGGGYSDQSGPPAGSVLMIYGLDPERMNCDRLFNILCLYGNVLRIKFLKSKEGSAMVQMGDGMAVERVMYNFNHVECFDRKLSVSISKQTFLQEVQNPHELSDGTLSYKDFEKNRLNRYSTPEHAAKNRITGPSETMHYFNAPPKVTEQEMRTAILEAGAPDFVKTVQFASRTERSSTGLLEWSSKSEAMDALAMANHCQIPNPDGGRPFTLKLCFSQGNIRDSDSHQKD